MGNDLKTILYVLLKTYSFRLSGCAEGGACGAHNRCASLHKIAVTMNVVWLLCARNKLKKRKKLFA